MLIPYMKQILGLGPIIFPSSQLSQTDLFKLVLSSIALIIYTITLAIFEIKKIKIEVSKRSIKKILPLMIILTLSAPFVYAYMHEQDLQNVVQTILNEALMEEDFDDLPPGSDPPGWEEDSGNWTTVDDGGNIVYYQDDLSDKEALTISTTGNTSWTDYTFQVDFKFVEGDPTKDDRAALLCFRYQGGNNYYYLAIREYHDKLDLYKHGSGGQGNLVASTNCTFVQDVWYHANITIQGDIVDISIDGTPYFSNQSMNGAYNSGSVGIGTMNYKCMFDNILVEPF